MPDESYWKERDAETDRREDIGSERSLWCEVLIESIRDNNFKLADAIERADVALAEYRRRFQ